MKTRLLCASLTAGSLLVLAAASVVGCGGASDGEELRSDQAPIAPAGEGDPGGETADTIVNHAVREDPHPMGPSSAADPGGSLATAPGAPYVPSQESTRTWATTPGIDPSSQKGSADTLTPVPDEAPVMKPPDLPGSSGADLDGLTAGNAQCAFDLYRELSAADGNLFFSPHSISTALAMTHAGARGDTETAMADTLWFSLPPERLHGAFAALGHDLDARSVGRDKRSFRLNSANAVWAQEGHPFLDSYLDVVRVSYGGEVSLADFTGNPDGSRSEINRWVEQRTEGRIEA